MGVLNYKLDKIEKAEKLTVSIEVRGTEFRNEWGVWVYPVKTEKAIVDDILHVTKLDEKAKDILEEGGKVFLMANELGTE